jgi:hypothetical protein
MEHDESRFVLERKARLQLQQLITDGNTPQKIVKRARIILMTAAGHGVMAIMREVGVSIHMDRRRQNHSRQAPPSQKSSRQSRMQMNESEQ